MSKLAEFSSFVNIQQALRYARYTADEVQRSFDPAFSMQQCDLEPSIQAECTQIAQVVAEARRNITYLDWSIVNPGQHYIAPGFWGLFVLRPQLPQSCQWRRMEDPSRPVLRLTRKSLITARHHRRFIDISLSPVVKSTTDLTRNQSTRKFLEDISESLMILSAIQAVTLPGHFSIGLDTVTHLAHHIEEHEPHLNFSTFFPFWTLPNLDFTVVSNRETPEHFSQNITQWSYSLTATVGTHRRGGPGERDFSQHCTRGR
ncbi:hypothetical protein BKA70DRAFT_1436964 [Coprinopsis sp. MPI-PUGE-AT-0042]|nr:hypothetical protein BKA70DRAFT_1436964 [Coprinopsis sp. MPI-PUGE-AT-0042]